MKQISGIINRIHPVIFFFCLSILIGCIWFRQGLIIATGESAIPFYNISKNLALVTNTWSEGPIGTPSVYLISSKYYYLALEQLSRFAPPELIQISIFTIGIFISLIGTFFVSRIIVNLTKLESVVAALFYSFNLFAMVNIWNRMQYPFIYFYLLFPLIMLLIFQGVIKKKFHYAIWVNLILVLFSISFASLPLLEVFWAVVLFTIIFYSALNPKNILYNAMFFLGCIVIWIIFNLWWTTQFVQVIQNTSYITSTAYTQQGNELGFITMSNQLGDLSYIFRLMHKSFFSDISQVWGNVYYNPLFIILQYSIPFLVFLPLTRKDKPKNLYYFLVLSLVTIFFAKGSSAPFGEIFLIMFSKIRVLESFRNPFEKIMIVLPFFYAPLVGYSLVYVIEKAKRLKEIKYNYLYLPVSLCLLFAILVYPYWNRWIFTSPISPANDKSIGYYVKIPDYINETNIWLNSYQNQSRVIALPMTGEGITYDWDYGYAGVETSNSLFDKQFISISTNQEFLQQISTEIEPLFFSSEEKYINLMQMLAAQFVLIRDDVRYKERQLTDPQLIKERISRFENLQNRKNIGKYSIYEIDSNDYVPKIYVAGALKKYTLDELKLFKTIFPLVKINKFDAFINNIPKNDKLDKCISTNVFVAKETFKQHTLTQNDKFAPIKLPKVSPENAVNELPYVNHLPGSWKYSLVRIREIYDQFANSTSYEGTQFKRLKLSSKRLKEIYLMSSSISTKDLDSEIADYDKTLKSIDVSYIYNSIGVQQELARHLLVIEKINRFNLSDKTISSLNISNTYISDLFQKGIPIPEGVEFTYKTREFELNAPQEGEYQIKLNDPTIIYPISLKLNNNEIKFTKESENIKLIPGLNTIKFNDDFESGLYHQEISERSIASTIDSSVGRCITQPSISFTKKTSSEYNVQVSDSIGPYILVFSESFHPLWKAYQGNNQIPDSDHFLVNDYANAWYIDKPGTYSLQLYFQPQETASKSTVISRYAIFITVLIGLVLLIVDVVKKTGKQKI